MTPAEASARVAREAAKVGRGIDATYVVSNLVDNDTGAPTGSGTRTTSVRAFGPIGESTSEVMRGATCQFVLPAHGLSLSPATGHQIVYAERTFLITTVEPHTMGGSTIAWTLSCSEQVLA